MTQPLPRERERGGEGHSKKPESLAKAVALEIEEWLEGKGKLADQSGSQSVSQPLSREREKGGKGELISTYLECCFASSLC